MATCPEFLALKQLRHVDIWTGELGAMNWGPRGAEDLYLMLEWADSRNLRELCMSHPKPFLGPQLVKEAIEQLLGLSSALCVVHEGMVQHGDLKPENILSFKGKDDKLLGTLKLGDWGLAKRQTAGTQPEATTSIIGQGTLRYEPPEATGSQLSDMWAMGCIILEFMVWLLYGKEGLMKFSRETIGKSEYDSPFYEVGSDKGCKINGAAINWMNMMAKHTGGRGDTALSDLLTIVRTKLLVVQLPSDPKSNYSPGYDSAMNIKLDIPATQRSDYIESGSRPYRARAWPMELREDLERILDISLVTRAI
ncbi:hypothetical protein FZEAL_1200 [Fusarium zealandicum]|uniref:Protein kinase domain-containing protein n=1 Tax=Fusarium zealandicum TaxID=1053134 RepID=A0A8H4UTT1_9HYPO|nr:hypothetical protein FZEAL_1200 [Fusarium zealandicum]